MTRLRMLPELQFAEDFKQLRRDIEEIKNAQRIGRDIMKPKIVEALDINGNPTEYDLVTVNDGFSNRTNFTVTLFADNQIEPWASLFVKFFYGNPSTPAAPGQTYGNFYLSNQKTNPGSISYRGTVGNNIFGDTTPVYVKFYMYATDTGTLEILPEFIE